MKLCEQYSLITEQNKSLEYKEFFSGKIVNHDDALKERIRSAISDVIVDELKISEKSFSKLDKVFAVVRNICEKTDIYNESDKLYNDKKRIKYIAEMMYDKHFSNSNIINEIQSD
jgi:orotate phosphoribosyltransferase-like protein